MSSLQAITRLFDLTGKRAVVTGGARGIGLGLGEALAAAGADVTLADLDANEATTAARRLQESGLAATGRGLDVMDVDQIARFFNEQDVFDILVNNAGTNRPKSMTDVTEADYDIVLGLNLKGAYFTAQSFARRLKAAGRPGSIIHMSSQMGHVGAGDRSLYCASKWAVEGMNKAISIELAAFGIRSNTIAPTFIETPMTRPFFEDQSFRESVMSKIKLGRLGTVQDLWGAAVFLASDASGLMTGSSIVVDGGWTAD